MDAIAVWKSGLGFDAAGGASGLHVPLGSEPEPGMGQSPDENGFRPMEILLVALAGCTGMDVISILRKKRQNVHSFEVRAHGERAETHPRIYTRIMVEYVVGGSNVEKAAVERAVELSRDKYCSVMAMLRSSVPIETKITINEE